MEAWGSGGGLIRHWNVTGDLSRWIGGTMMLNHVLDEQGMGAGRRGHVTSTISKSQNNRSRRDADLSDGGRTVL